MTSTSALIGGLRLIMVPAGARWRPNSLAAPYDQARPLKSRSVIPLYEDIMRPLRYSINVTLDGCCDHRPGIPDEELHRHAVENLNRADALFFGRVTYEMMESAFRSPARTGAMPHWMQPFARTINAAR